ncbi:MAG TPA: 2-phosphosulfolactate phosphatase [Steroidobacteraceae bacterium]|jgi:2-phosphosulfolactate phosphatase|nr:2-phosphosulfolactate phosphatase [Steroidobacteraceae bacterium]
MQIESLDFVAGARAARGVAVIIDVFRAFSVACYAAAQGVERIIPVGAAEDALQLKRADPRVFAVGERYGRKLPGFDCGNSPTELERFDLRGRTLVHTTHAGTQGLVNALAAEVVLTGSLVNAGAICRYLAALAPASVSLVRMGVAAAQRSEADDVCAELLTARLSGQSFDVASIVPRLRRSPEAQKFFDPAADWAPERDFELCTALDRFDFVLRLGESADGTRSLIRAP